jgi:fatty-acyl-CoA synthase
MFDPVHTYSRTTPARLAIGNVETGERLSWLELNRKVDRLAAWLVMRLGPQSGERVAVIARNHPHHLVLQFACARAGAIFVPLNWRLAPPELAQIVSDAAPALIFADAEFSVAQGIAETMPFEALADLGDAGSAAPDNAGLGWDAPTTLLYTSGTTGRPKGVIVTAANAFWGNCNFCLGNQVDRNSSFLCDMPLFHTAGLFVGARAPLWAGGSVWISQGFDPARTIARIADPALGITHYFSVPQMAASLWQHPDFVAEKFRGLTLYATGGAPNPAVQVERFVRAGIPLSDGFGMSETGSNFGMPVDDPELLVAKAGSCGLPFATLEARIVGADGAPVARGETGELQLKGPSVTPGYWKQRALTAAAFVDGWFRTGDAARQDDHGFYYLVDRIKDMFISGGENVYPAEVEAVIAELPTVAEVAVIGVGDERWGEVGRAHVVPVPGVEVTPDDIIAHCRTRLAGFKVPKSVVVMAAIPRTGSGKAQKHLLRQS